MRIVRNNIIPFKGFKAINLFGILFCRRNAVIGSVLINHEEIHTAQMKEMLYVFFYIWYNIEWLIRFLMCLDFRKAYREVLFEQEAYRHDDDMEYLRHRKHYAWLKSG